MKRLHFACLLAVSVGVLAACGSSGDTQSGDNPVVSLSSPASQFKGATFEPAKHLPDVTLADTSGKPWNLMQRGAGKVTIVYFGYTNCSDVCPTDVAAVGSALRMLPGAQQEKVQVLFVTVDPRRDTGPVMRKWLDNKDVGVPDFVGLTGTNARLTEAAGQLGLQFQVTSKPSGLEEVEHSSQMTAFDRTGTANLAWLDPINPADIAHDVRLLISGVTPS